MCFMLRLSDTDVWETDISGWELRITLRQDFIHSSRDMMLSNHQESVLLTFRLIWITFVHFDIFLFISIYLLPQYSDISFVTERSQLICQMSVGYAIFVLELWAETLLLNYFFALSFIIIVKLFASISYL